jgi:hypothetical protein
MGDRRSARDISLWFLTRLAGSPVLYWIEGQRRGETPAVDDTPETHAVRVASRREGEERGDGGNSQLLDPTLDL